MEQQSRWVTTDADGRWEFKGLPAGRYQVTVSKGGYLTLQYGQQAAVRAGHLLDLAEGQALEKIELSLPKGSSCRARSWTSSAIQRHPRIVVAMRHRYSTGSCAAACEDSGIVAMASTEGSRTTPEQYRLHRLASWQLDYLSAVFGSMAPGRSDDRTAYAPTSIPVPRHSPRRNASRSESDRKPRTSPSI